MSVNKYNPATGELTPIAGGTLYADSPIGTILPFGGTTAPDGFLLCQGQAVSRTVYTDLFAVIGTSFGSGDGSTTFNLPDLKGKTLVGLDSSDTNFNELGKIGGSKTHRHDFQFALYDYLYQPSGANAGMSGESDNAGAYRYSTGKYQGGIQTSTTSVIVSTHTGYSSETANKITTTGDTDLGSSLQPYSTVNYIIKATQVDVPADFAPVDAVENGNMKAVTSNAVAEAMAVTTGNGTRNATYVKSDSFTATWTKIGHVVTAEVQFNLSQATLSTEELITGFPKPVCPVAVVAQGEANDKAYGLVLRTNGVIRTHYQGVANQFYHATITYLTTE